MTPAETAHAMDVLFPQDRAREAAQYAKPVPATQHVANLALAAQTGEAE